MLRSGRHPARAIALAVAFTALAGCGGGSSGGGGTEPTDPALATLAAQGYTIDADQDDSTADRAGGRFYRSGQNSALLQGETIGNGSIPNAELVQSFPFRVLQSDADLRVRHASRTTGGVTSNDQLVVVLENTGSSLRCGVVLDQAIGVDAGGNEVSSGSLFGTDDGQFQVYGSIGRIPTLTEPTSRTCSPPGELAYLSALVPDERFDGVRAVRFGELTSALSAAGQASASLDTGRIVPTGYTVREDLALSVALTNTGSEARALSGIDVYFLDDTAQVIRTSSSSATQRRVLEPGASFTYNVLQLANFNGVSSAVRVIVDFDDVSAEASRTGDTSDIEADLH